jgi:hypothetical protein
LFTREFDEVTKTNASKKRVVTDELESIRKGALCVWQILTDISEAQTASIIRVFAVA